MKFFSDLIGKNVSFLARVCMMASVTFPSVIVLDWQDLARFSDRYIEETGT